MNSLDKITQRLHTATKHGDTELALSSIEQGAAVNQGDRLGNLPLHIALRHGHTELALSLIKHGAFVNKEDRFGDPPLHIAVRRGHIELALSMIEHGVFVNKEDRFGGPPLHIAVRRGHAELAVLLIKHGASANKEDKQGDVPLHIAVSDGHTELELSLIKHGASVNQSDGFGNLPIIYYVRKVNKDAKHLHDEIFTKLIPGGNMDILKTICQILNNLCPNDTGEERKLEVVSSMLHKLIQHLIVVETLSITIRKDFVDFKMNLNQHAIVTCPPLKATYLCSVLLILLRCNVSYVDEIASSLRTSATTARYLPQAHAVDALWNTYKQKTGVRKLQALCIQKSRQLMYSLTDESFQSLPVPSYLQKMLMLQDIADILLEGYKMWPKIMPIEELMIM